MTTHENNKALDRVRKLLELSKSENVNEASNAAAAAQALMSRHNITAAMAVDVGQDADEREEPTEVDTLHTHSARNLPTWKGLLGMALVGVNQCRCYRSGNTLKIIGTPSDASTVRYLFTFLAREIDRLCKQETEMRGSPGRTWANNFRLGAVSEISRRLKEAHRKVRSDMKLEADAGDSMGTGAALMRINNAIARIDKRSELAEARAKKMKLRAGGRSHSRHHTGAREAGRRAGASIDLGGSKSSLGSGNRRSLGQ
jgi:hypothetical protein